MSREPKKAMDKITAITENWIKASYSNATVQDIWKYKNRMNDFLEFAGLTDSEFLEGYKRSKDRVEWSKQIGLKVVAFYNKRVQEGYATNTARAEVSTIRAFCRDNATTLILPRRKIAKAKSAKGEHEFTRDELAKMFYIGDVRAKAILSTGVSLGFAIQDFSELKREQIESLVDKSINEKIDFIGFDYERGKTGVESRSHLTPEAVNSLKAWFIYIDAKRAEKGLEKSKYVFCNGNGSFLNEQTVNDILKDLVTKANISVTGKIKFHLLRKFLMNALHDAGFSDWEVKRALGKEISTSDETYLKGISRKVTEKFPTIYEYIRLTGFTNHNATKLEETQAEVQKLQIKLEHNILENEILRRIFEYSIPKEALQNAITKIAKDYGMSINPIEQSKDANKSPIELLSEQIEKLKTIKPKIPTENKPTE
jgi:site-specific recombinase XerD